MEKFYNEDGTFTEEGKARFINYDDTWAEEAGKLLSDLTKEIKEAVLKDEEIKQERQDRFMKALEEAIKKEPKYNIYKNGNINLNYDKDDNYLYFSFRLEEKDEEERIMLRNGIATSIMRQISLIRECTFMNIDNMIDSLNDVEDDIRSNICWSFRAMNIIEKVGRSIDNFYYRRLYIEPSSKHIYYIGTQEAYSTLFKWKLLMIAYDRLLKWSVDNEDTIRKYDNPQANILLFDCE